MIEAAAAASTLGRWRMRMIPLRCSRSRTALSTFAPSAGFTPPSSFSRVSLKWISKVAAFPHNGKGPNVRSIVIFATGVLTIPSAMYVLGALPGAINVLGWQFLNTYCAIIQGNFRNSHAGCHSIADMANVVGGLWLKEVVGVFFLVTYAIVGASGIFGASVGLNALSNHAICTNYFMLVATVAVFILASARKFEKIAWLTWAGFLSVFIAVFIVV